MEQGPVLRLIALAIVVWPAAGCGDDAPGGIDANTGDVIPGFPTPTTAAHANQLVAGAWTDLGLADWTCLNAANVDDASTQAIALSGIISDFQNGNPVGGGTITAFPFNGLRVTGNSGMTSSSDDAATRGQYAMTLSMLPADATRYGFKIEATGYITTYVLGLYLPPATPTQTLDVLAFSQSTLSALPAFIGDSLDPGQGLVVGTVRDCQGREVSNAVATLSSTSATLSYVSAAHTYYFSAGTSSLPATSSAAPVTNQDGMFMVLDVPPQGTPAYAQVWGFRTDAELATGIMTLLSEVAMPIEADAVMSGPFEPMRN